MAGPINLSGAQGAQAGDGNQQLNVFGPLIRELTLAAVPAPREPGPTVVGTIPQQAAAFRPRPALAAALMAGPAAGVLVHAVTGMRGVGKTQLAAAYARNRLDAGWRLVAWVNAGDPAELLAGLARLAAALGISEPAGDPHGAGQAVRGCLEADGERCLLVFDNVADVAGLRPFLPTAGRAQVVITTAWQEAATLGTGVAVPEFGEEEAAAFLAQRTGHPDDPDARELARQLGFLPLALAQAAAVIARQRLDYRTYLSRMLTLPLRDYLTPASTEPYPLGFAQTVILALGALDAADLAVLGVVSLLSAAGVSRQLLRDAGRAGLLSLPGPDPLAADQQVDEVIGRLAGVSLLTFTLDDAAVAGHPLTMRAVREWHAAEGRLGQVAAVTAQIVCAVTWSLPKSGRGATAAREIIQQVLALHQHLAPFPAESAGVTPNMLALRQWALGRLNQLGDSATLAVALGEQLAADCEEILGPDSPGTLAARSRLAYAYSSAGRHDEAIALYRVTLADLDRVLGAAHPDTQDCRRDLADAYEFAGVPDASIALRGAALADRELALGADHPDTLASREDLARAYRSGDRVAEAITLYEDILADRERILGPGHPDTRVARHNLAVAYEEAGRAAEAIELLDAVIADDEAALGPDHPEILTARHNLAAAYEAAGLATEAVALLEEVITARERALGARHTDTLASRNNLASACEAAGDLARAARIYQDLLADCERDLGRAHPLTRIVSGNALAVREPRPTIGG